MPEASTNISPSTAAAPGLTLAGRRVDSIRSRLLLAFVLLVLLPVMILSLVLVISSAQGSRQQVRSDLETALTYKEAAIDDWMGRLETQINSTALGLAGQSDVQVFLQQDTALPEDWEAASARLDTYLRQVAGALDDYDELIWLDQSGKVLLATGSTQVGVNLSSEAFFLPNVNQATVPPPVYSQGLGYVSFFAVAPVSSASGERLGLLVGRVNKMPLNEILAELQGLGDTGETYLVGQGYLFLNLPRYPADSLTNQTDAAVAALGSKTSGSSTYESYRGVQVFGVYHWLPQLGAALVAEQDLSESARDSYAVVAVNLSIGLASLLIAMVASLVITADIATPVSEMAGTAVQAAQGDLSLKVDIEREDEIGDLAQAFNTMTEQLRQTLEGLEQQVSERTFDLEQRTAYLQASADVSQVVNSILEPDRLVQDVVDLIRERFGLYYVGLFQLDETGDWAVLRAGTGDAGKAMVGRGHRIRAGMGMIGWCVANARPRIALIAEKDAVRLRTSELPDTRSEAALPLRSRGRVIGALSIQSALPNAFDDENISVFQVMADQVAVAIDNARLYVETQQALEDVQRFYSEQSLELWRDYLQRKGNLGVRSNQLGTDQGALEWGEEMVDAFWSGEQVHSAVEQEGRNVLAVPIKSRDVVVGVLNTYKPAGAGDWTEEEKRLLGDLSDQLGVALETAQFFSETRERAEVERLVGEITAHMRQTLDVDQVLQTAAREMRQVLDLAEVEIRLRSIDENEEEAAS